MICVDEVEIYAPKGSTNLITLGINQPAIPIIEQ
jgi:hypothetical protein